MLKLDDYEYELVPYERLNDNDIRVINTYCDHVEMEYLKSISFDIYSFFNNPTYVLIANFEFPQFTIQDGDDIPDEVFDFAVSILDKVRDDLDKILKKF